MSEETETDSIRIAAPQIWLQRADHALWPPRSRWDVVRRAQAPGLDKWPHSNEINRGTACLEALRWYVGQAHLVVDIWWDPHLRLDDGPKGICVVFHSNESSRRVRRELAGHKGLKAIERAKKAMGLPNNAEPRWYLYDSGFPLLPQRLEWIAEASRAADSEVASQTSNE